MVDYNLLTSNQSGFTVWMCANNKPVNLWLSSYLPTRWQYQVLSGDNISRLCWQTSGGQSPTSYSDYRVIDNLLHANNQCFLPVHITERKLMPGAEWFAASLKKVPFSFHKKRSMLPASPWQQASINQTSMFLFDNLSLLTSELWRRREASLFRIHLKNCGVKQSGLSSGL